LEQAVLKRRIMTSKTQLWWIKADAQDVNNQTLDFFFETTTDGPLRSDFAGELYYDLKNLDSGG
jgi:hypothetical protein